MFKDHSGSGYGTDFRRRQALQTGLLIAAVVLILACLAFPAVKWYRSRTHTGQELLALWDAGSYNEVYALSGELLKEKPLEYQYLTIHGFSAFQLGIAQINAFDTTAFVDDSIWSLRKALLLPSGREEGSLFYVLGKAYYYKGQGYADLAVKYLEKARSLSYTARDIPEYLGLAYAAIQDYHSSVEAFSQALNPAEVDSGGEGEKVSDPSDILLLAIARSYIALDEKESAKAYLVRCAEISKDSKVIDTARLLLGSVLAENGETREAEKQYLAVIAEDSGNAEAYYQLGELYASGGDLTRARAQWRQAVRINPAHKGARARLNM